MDLEISPELDARIQQLLSEIRVARPLTTEDEVITALVKIGLNEITDRPELIHRMAARYTPQ